MIYLNKEYNFNKLNINFDPFIKKSLDHKKVLPYRNIKVDSFADDFYSNLIDWSNNLIYYSINDEIYSYDFHSAKTTKIFSCSTTVTSLKFNKILDRLIIGTTTGALINFDVSTLKSTSFNFHKSRVGVLKNYNKFLMTGSRDRKSKIIDFRTNAPVLIFGCHTQEICGLSIQKLLATGGNDNKIYIFDIRRPEPLFKLNEHKAAVKALCWHPTSNLLISGGGSADKTLKLYDISNKNYLIKSINFESQICNLKWLKNNLILSTFGYSDDDTKLLKEFKVIKKFVGHKNRVIHFSISEDQKYFVTGSGDGTIKFWEVTENNNEIKIR